MNRNFGYDVRIKGICDIHIKGKIENEESEQVIRSCRLYQSKGSFHGFRQMKTMTFRRLLCGKESTINYTLSSALNSARGSDDLRSWQVKKSKERDWKFPHVRKFWFYFLLELIFSSSMATKFQWDITFVRYRIQLHSYSLYSEIGFIIFTRNTIQLEFNVEKILHAFDYGKIQ